MNCWKQKKEVLNDFILLFPKNKKEIGAESLVCYFVISYFDVSFSQLEKMGPK